jgi:hypothetical protein
MAKKRNLVLGVRLAGATRVWLDERAKADGLTVSQVVRRALYRAQIHQWTFGDVVTPDAARKAGGA